MQGLRRRNRRAGPRPRGPPDTPEDDVTVHLERAGASGAGSVSGFTAMVVDDHPLVRESKVARLTTMGAREVVEAASIAEARARARASGPAPTTATSWRWRWRSV